MVKTKNKITIDKMELKSLVSAKGPGVKKEVDDRIKHFEKKPFKTQTRDVFLQKHKVMITFYNSQGIGEQEEHIPKESLELLKNPNLFNEITDELSKKIVREKVSRKIVFLCTAGGRLVENSDLSSFNLLVNDGSGVGKDYLVRSVLEIIPREIWFDKTRISSKVLNYWKPVDDWDGYIFYPEDVSNQVLNDEVFKCMCSSGSKATIVINNEAVEIDIIGKPVMITTTATSTPNIELVRRFLILNLDDSEEQTKLIMEKQSENKEDGITSKYDEKFIEAQRYLKRVKVKVPFATKIPKYFPTDNIIMRTNYPRFLDYICSSTALHQFQREIDDKGFYLSEEQDYELARLCFEKVFESKTMIPLTKNQSKIIECFDKGFYKKEDGKENELYPKNDVSASEFEEKYPLMTLKHLIENFNKLTGYGILQVKLEMGEFNREIKKYSLSDIYRSTKKFTLPTFEKLIEEKESKESKDNKESRGVKD